MKSEMLCGVDVKIPSSEYLLDSIDSKDDDWSVLEMDKPWSLDDIETKKDDSLNEYSTELDKPLTHIDYNAADSSGTSTSIREVEASSRSPEVDVDKKLQDTDGNALEETDQLENPRDFITRNSSLEGDIHPITGVPFERKKVEDANGEKVEGVFPIFDSTFDVQLPEDFYLASDREQFDYCNERLMEAYENGELDDAPFNERQREQIANGDKPQGYTWHHNEEIGKMELIETEIHDKTGHTGGKVIWGGGQDAR